MVNTFTLEKNTELYDRIADDYFYTNFRPHTPDKSVFCADEYKYYAKDDEEDGEYIFSGEIFLTALEIKHLANAKFLKYEA